MLLVTDGVTFPDVNMSDFGAAGTVITRRLSNTNGEIGLNQNN